MKVQMSLNEDLVARADKYAKANYMTRSALVTTALNQFLLASELSSVLTEMSVCMRKIADTGSIDESTKKDIEELELLAKMLVESK
jgi:hypothetical protein|nr:unnamed protein product [uncultured bacterium]